MNRPDVKGREGILAVHTKKIPLVGRCGCAVCRGGTAGFSGADLANLVNEAALNAARYSLEDRPDARLRVRQGQGAHGIGAPIHDDQRRREAGDRHPQEAGHALLAVLLPHADPIHKVTIIPRGMALGLTQQLPLDDKHNYAEGVTSNDIESRFCSVDGSPRRSPTAT